VFFSEPLPTYWHRTATAPRPFLTAAIATTLCGDTVAILYGCAREIQQQLSYHQAHRPQTTATLKSGARNAPKPAGMLGRRTSVLKGDTPMIYVALFAVGLWSIVRPAPLFAQTDLTFEVASVKPNKSPDFTSSFRRTPAGLTITNMTLRRLIQTAYELEDFAIGGGPAWIGSERFDIEAKASAAATPAQLNAMLRSLLAERFALRVRRETVEGQTYHLVQSRNKLGPQIRRSSVDCRSKSTPDETRNDPTRCSVKYGFESIEARGMPLELLVLLTASLQRTPITDQTGLKGGFDYELHFNRSGAPDSPHPSIFTALDEQLGLKLQEQRGPVTMLVIDRVESLVPD
jgi:uncharacterized protein (TIGR03435 family)